MVAETNLRIERSEIYEMEITTQVFDEDKDGNTLIRHITPEAEAECGKFSPEMG